MNYVSILKNGLLQNCARFIFLKTVRHICIDSLVLGNIACIQYLHKNSPDFIVRQFSLKRFDFSYGNFWIFQYHRRKLIKHDVNAKTLKLTMKTHGLFILIDQVVIKIYFRKNHLQVSPKITVDIHFPDEENICHSTQKFTKKGTVWSINKFLILFLAFSLPVRYLLLLITLDSLIIQGFLKFICFSSRHTIKSSHLKSDRKCHIAGHFQPLLL